MAKSMALRSKMKYDPSAELSQGPKMKKPAVMGFKKMNAGKMMGMALAGKKGK